MQFAALRRCITMLTILLCLAHILVSELYVLLAALEVQSAILALAVLSGLAGRLWLSARPRPPKSVPNINLLSV
jgi:hypothetical protein